MKETSPKIVRNIYFDLNTIKEVRELGIDNLSKLVNELLKNWITFTKNKKTDNAKHSH